MKGGVYRWRGSVTSEGRGLQVEGVCGVEGSVTSEGRGLWGEGVWVE